MAFTPFSQDLPTTQPVNNQPTGSGFTPYNQNMPNTPPPQPGVLPKPYLGLDPNNTGMGDIVNAFKGGVQQVKEGVAQASQGGFVSGLEGGVKAVAGGVNAAMSPFAPVGNAINQATQPIVNKISDNPTVQKFAQSNAGKTTARIAEDVGNVNTIAGAGVALAGGEKAITKTPEELATKQLQDEHATAQAKLQSATKDTTPSYNPKMIKESPIKTENGNVPRVSEAQGLLGTRKVNATPSEVQAAQELSKTQSYNPKGTNLEKYNAVQGEIASKGKELQTSLKNEGILRPPKEIVKVVNDAIKQVPKESLLLQKSDPVIGNYMRVLKNAVTQNDGTLAGELKVRQAMDNAYTNARGKLAFGSDKISALDDIHTAGRDALNQDIHDHARSTDVKASLKSQSNLFRASDVLLKKAEGEGGSKIEQLVKNHPVAAKVAGVVTKAAGLDTAVHLIK